MSLKEELDRIMQEEIDADLAVGTELFIYHNNKKIYSGCFGHASLEGGELNERSIFRMFSMTKPVTALAAYIAMQKGLFKPEDRISDFIPAYKNAVVLDRELNEGGMSSLSALYGGKDKTSGTAKLQTVPLEREIMISDCLNMTAGLEYPNDQTRAGEALGRGLFWKLEEGYPDRRLTTLELLTKTAEYPLLYQPGEHWNYSLCADLIAAVIEITSGIRYGEFLKREIFDPLGMEDTDFYIPSEKIDRLVCMYDRQQDEWKEWEGTFLGMEKKRYNDPYLQGRRPVFESGGAGLVSTPVDYEKIALLFANMGTLPAEHSKTGRSACLLSEESIRRLTSPSLTPSQQATADWYSLKGYNYGSFVRVLEDPELAMTPKIPKGEFGWDGWAGTYFSVDPVNNIVFMYFINVTNGNREWQMKKLKNVLYEQL